MTLSRVPELTYLLLLSSEEYKSYFSLRVEIGEGDGDGDLDLTCLLDTLTCTLGNADVSYSGYDL